MEQESDRYADILQRLSPEVQQTIRDQEEHPVLPDWPVHTRGVPNIYLRSALFGVIKRGKRRAVKKETIGTFKGLNIRYTGWQLDQGDLDVLVQSMHLHKFHLDPDSAQVYPLYCQRLSAFDRAAIRKIWTGMAQGFSSPAEGQCPRNHHGGSPGLQQRNHYLCWIPG